MAEEEAKGSCQEEALEYRKRFEKLVADISASFLNLPAGAIDGWINSSLRLVASFEGVDRSYIFLFDEKGSTMDNTHEWCAAGVEPQKDKLKALPLDTFPWWMMKLKANEEVNIPYVASLPPEASAEKDVLEPQGIKSLLAVPINIEGRVSGFLGLDSVKAVRKWSPDSVTLIRTIATTIGASLARKRAEDARAEALQRLAESEERWKFALEGAGDGLWDWDVPGEKVFFSPRWKEMLGYADSEVGGSLDEWSSRVHPDDMPGTMSAVKAHLEGRTPYYFSEHRMKCKDGTYKWILDRGKVVSRSPDGKPLRAIGTHTDIDERKRLETERGEAVARLTALIQTLRAGLLLETPDRKVLFANSSFCEMFSVSAPPESLKGADCVAAAAASAQLTADPETFLSGVEARIRESRPVSDTEVLMKDGRILLQGYLPLHLPDGSFIGHMWKYTDVTSDRALERLRSEVMHHVNHELRRPVANQILSLDYLRGELSASLRPEQLRILDAAIDSAQSMSRMVGDLVEATRSETGKLSVSAERVDLRALVSDIWEGARLTAVERKLKLLLEAEDGVPHANADPVRVRQIVGNLIDNAFKFTPEGGTVRLGLRRAPGRDGMAEIRISDDGPGLDKADLGRVFDRLYQTANVARRGMKGLGLGLYICRMLVELQGGAIGVESEKGKGAAFFFTLPLREETGGAEA